MAAPTPSGDAPTPAVSAVATTFCAVCGVECGSAPRLGEHTAGKKHRLLARSYRPAMEPEPEPSPALRASIADVASAVIVGRLEEAVTVVVTTSPVHTDPDLGMIQATFASFEMAGLGQCRKLLVCDHFDCGVPRGRRAAGEHGGVLPEERITAYKERTALFRQAEWALGTEILELSEWHGFGLATKRALELVATPLVIVIQHDLAFMREVDLRPAVLALLEPAVDANLQSPAPAPVNCIYFGRESQRNYRENLRSRTKLEVGAPVDWMGSRGETMALTRLPQFCDGTHLARVSWYRGIFQSRLRGGRLIGPGSAPHPPTHSPARATPLALCV